GEGDHLAGVRRIGDDLLVAGQHSVENDLTGGDTRRRRRADCLALERRAVGQDQQGVVPHHTHLWASASATTGSPRNKVWRTRPVSLLPAYGVLRLRLARRSGSTTHTASGSITVMLAGAPSAMGPPCCPDNPAMFAAFAARTMTMAIAVDTCRK